MGLNPNDPIDGSGPNAADPGASTSQGPTADGDGELIPGLETSEPAEAPPISTADFARLNETVQTLVVQLGDHGKRFDHVGNELGTVRTLLTDLAVRREEPQAPVVQRTPEEEADAFSRDPRGYLTEMVQGAVRQAVPKPDPQAERTRANKEDLRAFAADYPDAKQYQGRMGQLIALEDNRVYDQKGNLDAYKTYKGVYLQAREESRNGAGNAANTTRAGTRTEQNAGKVLSAIPGASATQGTPGGLPRSLTPERLRQGLRGKSKKAILEFASKHGLVSETDPPK